MPKKAIVAIGGNSLIRDQHRKTVEDQYNAIVETTRHLADIVEAGYDIVVTHGNGPQVGFILRRSEIAHEHEGLHFVPLVSCVADTQGAIGYQIQQAMGNEFKKRGLKKKTVSIVTQVKVDPGDPAFKDPSKPIGSFYTIEQKNDLRKNNPQWKFSQDAGRGYRRVVPSPRPVEIIELEAIKSVVEQGCCVVAVGGGGIPVIETEDQTLRGMDAVIDKDHASALLAGQLRAELLIISTSVDRVCLDFGTPREKPLSRITQKEALRYVREGHFAAGSMLPKMEAIIAFLENGGEKAIVTRPENLKRSLSGECGTSIVKD